MRFHVFAVVFACIATTGHSQDLSLYRARQHGAEAKECLTVRDQDGLPVADVHISGGLQTGGGANDCIPIDGWTDKEGKYVIKGKCTNRIACRMTKDGYYPTTIELADYGYTHSLSNGLWHPYGEKRIATLKAIKKPGTLIVFPRELRETEVPAQGKWLGFDLELHDWTTPFGAGIHDDILIRINSEMSGGGFRHEMQLSFTNNPYAGACVREKDLYSEFKTAYAADPEVEYNPNLTFYMAYLPGKGKTSSVVDDSSYLVVRTRTDVDKEGKLISAHYGIIAGPLLFDDGKIVFSDGCFNPTPNDVNLEDGRNLRKSLKNHHENALPRKR